MTLFVILPLIIITAVLLGAFYYTLKQPSNPRKLFKRCAYSGSGFIVAMQLIQATNGSKQSILGQSPLAFITCCAIATVICFLMGWSIIGIRQEKKKACT